MNVALESPHILCQSLFYVYPTAVHLKMNRQSTVRMAFDNYDPGGLHFSVKLPYISFFTHHESKSLELEIARFFLEKSRPKPLKQECPTNTRFFCSISFVDLTACFSLLSR